MRGQSSWHSNWSAASKTWRCLGGLDSTGGAIVGGLVVGMSEALAQGYESHLRFLGLGFSSVMPYVVMVAVLLIRPAGLFGTKELHRV